MARLDLLAACHKWAKDSRTSFAHDRTQTVGASEIARCIKAVAAKKQGVKQDKEYVDDPGFAVRGNIIEDHWATPVLTRAAARAGGELLWAGQANQQTIEWTKKFASVTPDGLFVGMPRDWLAEYGVKKCSATVLSEVKSIDPRIAPDRLPKEGHAEQAHYGMGLVRATYEEYQPDYALVTYWNCSKLTDYHPIVVRFSEPYFARQLSRAKKCVTTPWKKLPQEGRILGGKQCGMCEYAMQCLGKRSTRAPDARKPKKSLIELGT